MTCQTRYLYPGTIIISAVPCQITTVLGTCVAVCLWDADRQAGGINHYILPLWDGRGLATPRFGDIAIARLLEGMARVGCHPESLTAKLFGGKICLGVYDTGGRNVELAREQLQAAGITVAAEDVGGNFGRRVAFDTTTGVVRLKRWLG